MGRNLFFLLLGFVGGVICTIGWAKTHTFEPIDLDNDDATTDLIVEDDEYPQLTNELRYDKITPESYENKSKTSFKVSRVLSDHYAISNEATYPQYDIYSGTDVVLEGKDKVFYDGQIVKVNKPMIVGTYKYGNRTLPVIPTE